MPKAGVVKAETARAVAYGTPRSRKGIQTRGRLFEAAREVFERDGFLTARIADIAATAGVSQGSFYTYFPTKEAIFREVAQAQEERLTAPADAGMELEPDGSPLGVIRRANRRYLERYRDASKLMGVIEQVSRYDEHVSAARLATMRHFVERTDRSIRRLQRQGLVDRKINPTVAADALGAMVGRFAELWLVQGYREYDFDEAVEQLSLLWANALGIAPAANERRLVRRRDSP